MLVAVLLPLSMAVWAQFNPADPAEPASTPVSFRLVTQVTPAGAGSTSGSGYYEEAASVSVNTSPNQYYTFLRWINKRSGETVSTTRSFQYTMPAYRDTLIAVYEYNYVPDTPDPPAPFDPANPSEPAFTNQFRLYLTTNIEGACSFNRTSGAKVEADTYVTVSATLSQNYDFVGWYQNGTLISSARSFSFLMPAENATLQAIVAYNPPPEIIFDPADPDEPASTPYTPLGDVNEDGIVNVMDATALIGAYLKGTTDNLQQSVADVNQDGVINVMDATEIINIYLHNR